MMKNRKYQRSMCLAIVVLFTVNLVITPNVISPAKGAFDAWLYRREITIDHTKVASDQTDFPVLIDIEDSSLKKAQSDGGDFLFTDVGQVQLAHEIEMYDYGSGHLVAWVKVPFISSTTDTILYMYYGNAAAQNQESPEDVWNPQFVMVQHLSEKSGNIIDSTGNDNDGTPQNLANRGINGKIDGSDEFNGASSFITIPHDDTISGFDTALTVETWARIDNTGRRQEIIGKYSETGNQRGWLVEYYSKYKAIAFYASNRSSNGATYKWWNVTFNPQAGNWYHISVVWRSRAIPQFYINGQPLSNEHTATGTVAAIFNNAGTPLEIGRRADVGRYFDGIIDEVRISNTARSAGWIETSFENQNDPSSFYDLGPEQGGLLTVSSPYPADGTTGVSKLLNEISVVLSDPDAHPIDYSVTMSPDDIVGSKSGTGIASGTTIHIQVSLEFNTLYSWQVQATDSLDPGETTIANYQFKTAKTGEPTQYYPLLKSSGGTNSTHEYLTCYNQSTNDPDGDPVTNVFNWYKDDVSMTGALWPFDTQSATVVKDYSGHGNDGTIQGASWTSNGVVGGAYSFDGVNDHITVPDQASLGGDGTWSEMSIEFWIKVAASLHGPRIVAKRVAGESSGSYTVGFQTSDSDPANTLFFGVTTDAGDGEIVCYDQPLAVGKWYHVVCTYKSGIVLAMYINGSLAISSSFAGKIIPQTPSIGDEPVFIGSDGSGDSNRWLNGTLDDVRIYNKALTSEQASQRYSESKDGLSKSATIVPQQTSDVDMEVWKCEVTPNDAKQDGEPKFSNPLTVQIYEPLIFNENPADYATRVSVSLSELSFELKDYQSDRMNYTVTTSPNIIVGSGSGKNVPSGKYHVDVSGLKTATAYTWQVNVTDGTSWTNKTYHFLTPLLTQKWTKTGLPSGWNGPVIANIVGDSKEEIIHAGIVQSTGIGRVTCLDANGQVLWTHDDPDIGLYCNLIAIDLNKDGALEIVAPLEFPAGVLALHPDGSTYWRKAGISGGSITSHPVAADIDGNGYPTIFVGAEDIQPPFNGKVSKIRGTDGAILNQTSCYRPCSGGFSIADTDKDGDFELFMGDRGGADEPGVAQGPEAWNAHTFAFLWSRPDLSGMFSSHCPILVDVPLGSPPKKDGKLEVVVENQRGGIYVLNATNGKTIKGSSQLSFPAHYQPSVYDIDGDGNPEILGADGTHSATPNDVRVWDLVNWTLDFRVDVGLCIYPPQLGEVTGDGFMDIIACNYTGIFIFSYNRQKKTYELVEGITGITGKLNYAVVQDIDADGLNEVIVQNQWGKIHVFDTSAPAPTPRARSEVQFYSERRLGAAEYVPPP